jgi:hypothetical protein
MTTRGAALRAAYPEGERCACTADGVAVPPGAFRVRTMNFGQHWRTPGMTDVPYRAEVPAALLRDIVRREHPSWMEDALAFPNPKNALEAALHAAGWPAADEALADPRLAALLAELYADDLLEEWFDAGRPDAEPGYLLNTIEAVRVAPDGTVVIEGRARPSAVPGVYQDM